MFFVETRPPGSLRGHALSLQKNSLQMIIHKERRITDKVPDRVKRISSRKSYSTPALWVYRIGWIPLGADS
jgi:hypothetical protein